MSYKVGYFVGSLSSTSINRVLSKALIRVAPDDLEFTEIPIGNLPLYSSDHDADYPAEARALKTAIESSDAVLFQALNDVGFTVPAQGSVYWNGEAMHTTDYKDLEQTPEKVSASITTSLTNAVHLARVLRVSIYPKS